jgi:hypothetical protein
MFTPAETRSLVNTGALPPSNRGLIPGIQSNPDRRKFPAKQHGHVKETTRPVVIINKKR